MSMWVGRKCGVRGGKKGGAKDVYKTHLGRTVRGSTIQEESILRARARVDTGQARKWRARPSTRREETGQTGSLPGHPEQTATAAHAYVGRQSTSRPPAHGASNGLAGLRARKSGLRERSRSPTPPLPDEASCRPPDPLDPECSASRARWPNALTAGLMGPSTEPECARARTRAEPEPELEEGYCEWPPEGRWEWPDREAEEMEEELREESRREWNEPCSEEWPEDSWYCACTRMISDLW
ncbi:hypothetical protein C8R44DRAFT_18089 [Mycena epipterygia]|nr:hypothetical protein C8R44DRAFT_18089 [Mycena epipterygia]